MSNWAQTTIDALRREETDIKIVPLGNSMRPVIYSGATVTLIPVTEQTTLSIGDIVLVDVPYVSPKGEKSPGTVLHFVREIEKLNVSGSEVYRIEDNRGLSNGWVKREAIHGKVVRVVQPEGKE